MNMTDPFVVFCCSLAFLITMSFINYNTNKYHWLKILSIIGVGFGSVYCFLILIKTMPYILK